MWVFHYVLHWDLVFVTYKIFFVEFLYNILHKICLYFMQGQIQRFLKEEVLYVGHHSWPTKKKLGFSWFKKAKITLETKSF